MSPRTCLGEEKQKRKAKNSHHHHHQKGWRLWNLTHQPSNRFAGRTQRMENDGFFPLKEKCIQKERGKKQNAWCTQPFKGPWRKRFLKKRKTHIFFYQILVIPKSLFQGWLGRVRNSNLIFDLKSGWLKIDAPPKFDKDTQKLMSWKLHLRRQICRHFGYNIYVTFPYSAISDHEIKV